MNAERIAAEAALDGLYVIRTSVAKDKISADAAVLNYKKLADCTPPMSFGRLLAHLATIVRNTMRPKGARPGQATFALTTRPNAKQQQALDLIAAIAV